MSVNAARRGLAFLLCPVVEVTRDFVRADTDADDATLNPDWAAAALDLPAPAPLPFPPFSLPLLYREVSGRPVMGSTFSLS